VVGGSSAIAASRERRRTDNAVDVCQPRTAKAADESVETIIQVGEYSSMSSTGHGDPSTSIEKFA